MEKQNYMLTRLSYHLHKLEHHASFKKTEQMNCKNSPQQWYLCTFSAHRKT